MSTLPAPRRPRLLLALLLAVPAVACDSSRIGDPCEISLECMPGQSCYGRPVSDAGFAPDAGFPQGFCSRACDEAGASAQCPGGSVCAPSGGLLICAPTCRTDQDCRTGYVCGAAGDQKACIFQPQ